MKKFTTILFFIFNISQSFGQVIFQKDLMGGDRENRASKGYELSDHSFLIFNYAVRPFENYFGCTSEEGSQLLHVDSAGDAINAFRESGSYTVWHDKVFNIIYSSQQYLTAYSSTGILLFSHLFNDSLQHTLSCAGFQDKLCVIAKQPAHSGTNPSNLDQYFLALYDSNGVSVSQIPIDSDSTNHLLSYYAFTAEDGGLFISKEKFNNSNRLISRTFIKYNSQLNLVFTQSVDINVDVIKNTSDELFFFNQDSAGLKTITKLDADLNSESIHTYNDNFIWINFSPMENNKWCFIFRDINNNFGIAVNDSTGTLIRSIAISDSNSFYKGFILPLSDNSILFGGSHDFSQGSMNLCYPVYSVSFIAKTDTSSSFIGIENIVEAVPASVYPNPFSTSTTFTLNNNYKDAHLSVFDLKGQLLKDVYLQSSSFKFERDELNAGIYIYKINKENQGFYIGKLIIVD